MELLRDGQDLGAYARETTKVMVVGTVGSVKRVSKHMKKTRVFFIGL